VIKLTDPVFNRVPQTFSYKFMDQSGLPIDVSTYSNFKLLVKARNVPGVQEVPATALDQYTVQSQSWTPARPNYYFAQFTATNVNGDAIYGEVIGFTVAENVNDMEP